MLFSDFGKLSVSKLFTALKAPLPIAVTSSPPRVSGIIRYSASPLQPVISAVFSAVTE